LSAGHPANEIKWQLRKNFGRIGAGLNKWRIFFFSLFLHAQKLRPQAFPPHWQLKTINHGKMEEMVPIANGQD
jgi:hypothetical protein